MSGFFTKCSVVLRVPGMPTAIKCNPTAHSYSTCQNRPLIHRILPRVALLMAAGNVPHPSCLMPHGFDTLLENRGDIGFET